METEPQKIIRQKKVKQHTGLGWMPVTGSAGAAPSPRSSVALLPAPASGGGECARCRPKTGAPNIADGFVFSEGKSFADLQFANVNLRN